MKHVVLAFHGHFERHGEYSHAMGDDAPVFVHGVNDDVALESFKQGVLLWLDWLAEEGDLDQAVKEGRAQVKFSSKGRSGVSPTVKRDGDRFEIELAGIR